MRMYNGRVRIFNKDALEVLPKLPEGKIALVFTDPPYGHNNNDGDLISNREEALGRESKSEDPRPILNDGEEAEPLLYAALPLLKQILSPGGHVCVCVLLVVVVQIPPSVGGL